MFTGSFRQDQVRIAKALPLFFVLIGLLSSCVSTKSLALFQEGGSSLTDSLSIAKRYVPTVQIGDILSIQVNSLNPEASAAFNLPESAGLTQGQGLTASANALAYQPGYLVNEDGTIMLTLIGKVPVAGKTTSQIADSIREKIKAYLKEPTVNVRNVNFRISVLGELNSPGLFLINNGQVSLPQALSMAGDLTVYGKRENVLVIREENGKKVFARVDLTKRDFFSSPYYYLHPNDVVYVEPGKGRLVSADNSYRVLPIVISGATAIIALISILTR
ncbi:MAG: polysaccharide biosynthesis/export family protein [Siphonobacter sp.]